MNKSHGTEWQLLKSTLLPWPFTVHCVTLWTMSGWIVYWVVCTNTMASDANPRGQVKAGLAFAASCDSLTLTFVQHLETALLAIIIVCKSLNPNHPSCLKKLEEFEELAVFVKHVTDCHCSISLWMKLFHLLNSMQGNTPFKHEQISK